MRYFVATMQADVKSVEDKMNNRFDRARTRFDESTARLNARFERLEARVDARCDRREEKLEKRLARMDDRIETIRGRVDWMNTMVVIVITGLLATTFVLAITLVAVLAHHKP
jgi:hypothetical protein